MHRVQPTVLALHSSTNTVGLAALVLKVCLQVRSILGQIRPDRQTLLFSATMPNKVENLVRDALTSPVRVTVGEVGAANEDIRQVCMWGGVGGKCMCGCGVVTFQYEL